MLRPIHFACVAALLLETTASALTIVIDYTYDQLDGGNFFGTNVAARASLEAAAADLSAAITSSLAAVPTDVFTGTSGGYSVSFDWYVEFTNPVTDATVALETWDGSLFGLDVVRVYAGMRPLGEDTLGMGGPGAAGFQAGAQAGPGGGTFEAAVSAAEQASNSVMPRGAGPQVTLTGAFVGDSVNVPFTLSTGLLVGNIWFDNDSNNDGAIDDASLLDEYWNFDLAGPVAGKHDFYSVALHELLHVLGIGASDAWGALASGTDWFGANASEVNGSGLDLLDPDSSHISEGVMSPRLSDGVLQDPVMSPWLLQGTRKTLTELDLAFLRDLDYATIPEPSTAALVGAALTLGLTSRKRNRAPAPCGDRSCPHS